MPTHPPLQPSAPESSRKPAQSPADAHLSGPGAPAAKPAREGTLFHLLVERGWDPELAYTADQRVHTMTSKIAAAGLQPVLAELRQIRESMASNLDKTETNLRREMAEREARLIKWMFGAMLVQTAVIVGFVVGVVPLLK